MKILQICEQFRPVVNGLTNHVYYLSSNLSENHEVTVFTSDIKNISLFKAQRINKRYEKFSNNLKIFRFKTYPPYVPYAKTYAMVPPFIKSLSKIDVDIIHSHSYPLLHSDIAVVASKLRKKPVVLTIHAYGGFLSNHYRTVLAKLHNPIVGKSVLKLVNKIIVLDPLAKNHFSKIVGEEDKIEVIPNGIIFDKFSNSSSGDFKQKYNIEGRVVLFVGLLQQRKGVQHLLKAASQILKKVPDTVIVIVGKGEYRKHLVKLSNDLGIEDKVKFFGFLSDQELLEVYSMVDILVLPSAFEGLPTVILEAMASGKPVVATNVGGIPSVVKDGITGFLVEYGNIEQLAEAIKTILTDENLARNMGKKGREIASNYDWSIISKKVERLYIQEITI